MRRASRHPSDTRLPARALRAALILAAWGSSAPVWAQTGSGGSRFTWSAGVRTAYLVPFATLGGDLQLDLNRSRVIGASAELDRSYITVGMETRLEFLLRTGGAFGLATGYLPVPRLESRAVFPDPAAAGGIASKRVSVSGYSVPLSFYYKLPTEPFSFYAGGGLDLYSLTAEVMTTGADGSPSRVEAATTGRGFHGLLGTEFFVRDGVSLYLDFTLRASELRDFTGELTDRDGRRAAGLVMVEGRGSGENLEGGPAVGGLPAGATGARGFKHPVSGPQLAFGLRWYFAGF